MNQHRMGGQNGPFLVAPLQCGTTRHQGPTRGRSIYCFFMFYYYYCYYCFFCLNKTPIGTEGPRAPEVQCYNPKRLQRYPDSGGSDAKQPKPKLSRSFRCSPSQLFPHVAVEKKKARFLRFTWLLKRPPCQRFNFSVV